MKKLRSFNPVADRRAQILILGSMPGEASLRAGEYYAHPRNGFWRIMADILGFNAADTYAKRLTALQKSGIALWDVLHSCTRRGSLDTAIQPGSVKTNDFQEFFRTHRHITHIFFNGATAERYYQRLVQPTLTVMQHQYQRLPSTSPAHAALSFDAKVTAWRTALRQARAHCTRR